MAMMNRWLYGGGGGWMVVAMAMVVTMSIVVVTASDGTIMGFGGQWPPQIFFNTFFLVYKYMYVCMYVLILAICFNKFAFWPLKNIIDLFKGHKKFYWSKIWNKFNKLNNEI